MIKLKCQLKGSGHPEGMRNPRRLLSLFKGVAWSGREGNVTYTKCCFGTIHATTWWSRMGLGQREKVQGVWGLTKREPGLGLPSRYQASRLHPKLQAAGTMHFNSLQLLSVNVHHAPLTKEACGVQDHRDTNGVWTHSLLLMSKVTFFVAVILLWFISDAPPPSSHALRDGAFKSFLKFH